MILIIRTVSYIYALFVLLVAYMELHLGLALSTTNSRASYYEAKSHFPFNHAVFHNKKRSFSQLLEHADAAESSSSNEDVMFPTLSLLPLTPAHHPNQDDEVHRSHCSTITKSDIEDDEEALAPVNYWRKKLRYDNEDDEVGENDHMVWIDHQHLHHHRRSNTLYVKVNMEGVGIARKVDLSIHHSFQTLKQTLMDMFGKCQQQLNSYELAYRDKDGDWLLAEDVSWRSFIECAQRLKLVKSGGS